MSHVLPRADRPHTHIGSDADRDKRDIEPIKRAGIAKFGQRRSVQGAVPEGSAGSNPAPCIHTITTNQFTQEDQ